MMNVERSERKYRAAGEEGRGAARDKVRGGAGARPGPLPIGPPAPLQEKMTELLGALGFCWQVLIIK